MGFSVTGESGSADIGKYFRRIAGKQEPGDSVGNLTWAGFDMDLVFGRLNQTLTISGKQVLYSVLRTPSFSRESLKEGKRSLTVSSGIKTCMNGPRKPYQS